MSKEFIQQNLRKYLIESLSEEIPTVKLYHRIGNKKGLELTDLLRSVITNGLICHDNGELGPIIWFSNEFGDYAKNGAFVVSIEYNPTTKEEYDIRYDNHNGYVHSNIPFNALEVIKIPVMVVRSRAESSDNLIEFINKGVATPERINGNKSIEVIYGDIFNKYVQPFINVSNFLSQIEPNKIKNIF